MITKRLYVDGQETKYLISDDGTIYSQITNKFLKPFKNPQGYCLIDLSVNGKTYTRQLHRLVAMTFIDNPNQLETVNHKDGDKTNNCVDNLEWMTRLDNVRHAWKTGLSKPRYGTDNPANVYTEEQIHNVCKMLEVGICSNKYIAISCNVNITLIRDIKFRGKWKQISKLYDIPTVPIGHKDDRQKIYHMIENGFTNQEILDELGYPQSEKRHISYVRGVYKRRYGLND